MKNGRGKRQVNWLEKISLFFWKKSQKRYLCRPKSKQFCLRREGVGRYEFFEKIEVANQAGYEKSRRDNLLVF